MSTSSALSVNQSVSHNCAGMGVCKKLTAGLKGSNQTSKLLSKIRCGLPLERAMAQGTFGSSVVAISCEERAFGPFDAFVSVDVFRR